MDVDSLAELEASEAQGYTRRRRGAVLWVGIVTLLVAVPELLDSADRTTTLGVLGLIALNLGFVVVLLRLIWRGFARPRDEPRFPDAWEIAAIVGLGGLLVLVEDQVLIVPMGLVMFAGVRLPLRIAVAVTIACLGITMVEFSGDLGSALGASLGVIGSGVGTIFGRRQSLMVHEARSQRLALARGAVAEERLRIGRDLHDLLGHTLLAITVKSELAGQLLDADPERARREIAEVEQTAREALDEVRETVAGYRAPRLIEEVDAATRMARSGGVTVVADVDDLEGLPRDTEAALGWAVREGISNVLRHAGAERVTVAVAVGDDEVVLDLRDDGRGPIADGPPGSGLAGLHERVAALDGQLTVGPAPGRGFRMTVRIPLATTAGPSDDDAGPPPSRTDLAGRPVVDRRRGFGSAGRPRPAS